MDQPRERIPPWLLGECSLDCDIPENKYDAIDFLTLIAPSWSSLAAALLFLQKENMNAANGILLLPSRHPSDSFRNHNKENSSHTSVPKRKGGSLKGKEFNGHYGSRAKLKTASTLLWSFHPSTKRFRSTVEVTNTAEEEITRKTHLQRLGRNVPLEGIFENTRKGERKTGNYACRLHVANNIKFRQIEQIRGMNSFFFSTFLTSHPLWQPHHGNHLLKTWE